MCKHDKDNVHNCMLALLNVLHVNPHTLCYAARAEYCHVITRNVDI